jgi:hypothetical protein
MARTTFVMIARASSGFSSRNAANVSPKTEATADCASTDPSFALVCPSNWISRSFTEITAVRPSRTSSPVNVSSPFLQDYYFLHRY